MFSAPVATPFDYVREAGAAHEALDHLGVEPRSGPIFLEAEPLAIRILKLAASGSGLREAFMAARSTYCRDTQLGQPCANCEADFQTWLASRHPPEVKHV